MTRSSTLALALVVTLASIPLACKRSEEQPPPPPPLPGNVPAMPAAPAMGAAQRIAAEQQAVAQDPKNLQAWIALGNDYFDTKQPQKAIDAYAKALELDPKNPDVLTDQGVMYRDLGQFQQAVANFQKANQVDPRHMQSLYNMGVVYAHDLKDSAKAIEAWQKVIDTSPGSPQAQQARQGIDELRGKK